MNPGSSSCSLLLYRCRYRRGEFNGLPESRRNCVPFGCLFLSWQVNKHDRGFQTGVSDLAPIYCCPLPVSCGCFGPAPVFSFVVRAAAANVKPRTRLSHMTPFSGRDWCTHERCRLMVQISQNFLPMIPRILRGAREFPRIFLGFSD